MAIRYAVLIAGVLSVTGCASLGEKAPAPTFEHLMFQAGERAKGGNLVRAKSLLQEAAKLEPTRKEPWIKQAEVEFESENYGASIISAQEALQRDPENVQAQSIQAVAGLRVAVQSLGRLRNEKDRNGPIHTEARKLAAKLRETLGAKALVPKQRAAKPKLPVARPVPTPASSNPFSSLPSPN